MWKFQQCYLSLSSHRSGSGRAFAFASNARKRIWRLAAILLPRGMGTLALWVALWGISSAAADSSTQDEVSFLLARNLSVLTNPVAYKAGQQVEVMNRCLLLGNGGLESSISAVEGRPELLRFTLNKNDFWRDHLTHGTNSAKAKGQYAPGRTVNVNPGYVDLRFPDFAGAGFQQVQDMAVAEVRTVLTVGGRRAQITSTIPKTATNLLVHSILNQGTNSIRLEVSTFAQQAAQSTTYPYDLNAGVEAESEPIAWVTRRTPLGDAVMVHPEECPQPQFRMWAAVATRVLGTAQVPTAVEPSTREKINSAATVTQTCELAPGQKVYVVTKVNSTGIPLTAQPADPLPGALNDLKAIDPAALDEYAIAHRAWWDRFWHRSYVRLDDEPAVERVYYGSLYVFGMVNKPGEYTSGCNSFGVEDAPMWTGDYHWNYNIEAPYYSAWSSDRVELSEPYDRAVQEHDRLGRVMAKNQKMPGTFFCIGTAPGGQVNENTSGYGHRSNAIEAALNQIDHYLFTYDLNWLKTNYSFLQAVADYWDSDLLKHKEMRPDGSYRYVVVNSAALEGCGGSFNATPVLGFLRRFYQGMIIAASDLNAAGYPTACDAARLNQWRDFLAHLPDYPVAEAFGRKVFRWSEDDLDPFAVGGWHWNLLQVYPSHQISLSSPPDLVKTADNSLVLRPEVLGRGSPYCEYFAIFARLGHYSPEILERLNWYLLESPYRMGTGNFAVQGGNVECVAIVDEIHNFLLQSQEGFLRLFPAWYHENGKFSGVRAEGAFLVSAEKRDGICREIQVFSEKGKPLSILNPWAGKTLAVRTDSGSPTPVSVQTQSYGQVCSFQTEVGQHYTIYPREGFSAATPFENLALHRPVTVSSTHDPRSRAEKPVWAHPTHVVDNFTRTWQAANLTDGNRSLSSLLCQNMGWCSVPTDNPTQGEWVMVDLGQPCEIRQVNLWPIGRGDVKYGRYDKQIVAMDHSFEGFPLDFDILVSPDGVHWQTVASRKDYLKMPKPDQKPKNVLGPETFAFAPQQARFVKVSASKLRKSRYFGRYTMQLAEIEVLLQVPASVPAAPPNRLNLGIIN